MSKDLINQAKHEVKHNEHVEIKSETPAIRQLSDKEILEKRAKKKAERKAAIQNNTRLFLDEKYKEAGYRYRIVNVTPGNVESQLSKGYEVVTHDMHSGSGSLANPECSGTPLEFEVGGHSGSMKAVWMRIAEDDAQILDEIRDDEARAQEELIKKVDGIPNESLVGSITKENLR